MPIVYMSTQWWRSQHPTPVFGGGPDSGVAPVMRIPVWWNVAGWLAWGILIASIRYSGELQRQRNEAAHAIELITSEEYVGAQHG